MSALGLDSFWDGASNLPVRTSGCALQNVAPHIFSVRRIVRPIVSPMCPPSICRVSLTSGQRATWCCTTGLARLELNVSRRLPLTISLTHGLTV